MFGKQFSLSVVLLLIAAATRTTDAFAVGNVKAAVSKKMSTTKTFVSDAPETTAEEMITMRSLAFEVKSKPLGMTLEEIESGGVCCLDLEDDGAAYLAGIREGDVLAALDGNERILSSGFDEATALLAGAGVPLGVKVYRQMVIEENEVESSSATTVKMSPRRLPSTKKIMKASTNAKFWQDPIMLGSAVLTVAMPLGIFIASTFSD